MVLKENLPGYQAMTLSLDSDSSQEHSKIPKKVLHSQFLYQRLRPLRQTITKYTIYFTLQLNMMTKDRCHNS